MIKKSHLGTYGVIVEKDKILLIQKSRGPYKGKYDLPGGSIEFGESIEDALIREIKEETNLDVKNFTFRSTESALIEYQNSSFEQVQFHHLGIVYDVVVEDVTISLKTDADAHDSLGAMWINVEQYALNDCSPFAGNVLKQFSTKFG